MNDLRYVITSNIETDQLLAEVYYKNIGWAAIFEGNPMVIRFYNNQKIDYWEFPVDEALEILEKAKKRLTDMGNRRD